MTSGNCQVSVQALWPGSLSRLAAGLGSRCAGNPRGFWAFRADLAEDTAVVAGALRARERHALADRVEDGHALADQAGRDLAEAVGAVEDGDVGPGQAGRRFLDDQRELVDEQLIERDPVVGRGG